LAVLK